MDQEKIGKFIAEKRREKGLTQEQLAEKLRISINAVSKWERGLSTPNVSLMVELCEILSITLNELFLGEHIKEKELAKKTDKNILDILKLSDYKSKKYKGIILIVSIIVVILMLFLGQIVLIRIGYLPDKGLAYSQEYVAGTGNIRGDVNIKKYEDISSDFAIGANKYGWAVFKNPKKAWERLLKNYDKGIELIRREYNLAPLNATNYNIYGAYGWQVTTGTDEEKKQASFVTQFMDIYENSFKRYGDYHKLWFFRWYW